jgi:hypothetical protein
MVACDTIAPGRRPRRILVPLSLALLLAAVAGCSMPITVSYSPIAAAEALGGDQAKLRVHVVRFVDDRGKKDSVGSLQNSFGGETKKLVTSDDLTMILAEATTDALRKGGAAAELHSDALLGATLSKEQSSADLIVGGKIRTIEVTCRAGWDTYKITSRVIIDICVRKGNKDEWIGPIEGTAERREASIVQTSVFTATLDTAIQNCMRNMVRHLKSSGVFVAAPTAAK